MLILEGSALCGAYPRSMRSEELALCQKTHPFHRGAPGRATLIEPKLKFAALIKVWSHYSSYTRIELSVLSQKSAKVGMNSQAFASAVAKNAEQLQSFGLGGGGAGIAPTGWWPFLMLEGVIFSEGWYPSLTGCHPFF